MGLVQGSIMVRGWSWHRHPNPAFILTRLDPGAPFLTSCPPSSCCSGRRRCPALPSTSPPLPSSAPPCRCRRSRRTRQPRCAASPLTSRSTAAPASSAASPPPRWPSSPRPTEAALLTGVPGWAGFLAIGPRCRAADGICFRCLTHAIPSPSLGHLIACCVPEAAIKLCPTVTSQPC